tara:strand:+ start:149 stop:979 length:831 start_codon:yes stop_codon:yes gene_type:complete
MASSLDLARTYTSYSGVDIKVVINGQPAGSMQALSYAIQREKAPIYVMGSVDPVSYSRGKRGIAGTMISLMMDTHFLLSKPFDGEMYLGDVDEVFAHAGDGLGSTPQDSNPPNTQNLNNLQSGVTLQNLAGTEVSDQTEDRGSATGGNYRTIRREADVSFNATEMGKNYRLAPVFYVDQILPFDITIAAANEYGQAAQMRLYGCEILNEGSGFSIDDIVIENQMTYVCRTILPWRSFALQAQKSGDDTGALVDARKNLYTSLTTSRPHLATENYSN